MFNFFCKKLSFTILQSIVLHLFIDNEIEGTVTVIHGYRNAGRKELTIPTIPYVMIL